MNCEVHGCESAAHTPYTLVPGQGWNWPTEVGVCNLHRDELSRPGVRWHFEHDAVNGTRVLRVGRHQEVLNEFVVLVRPTSAIGYGRGREVSDPAEDGLHFPMTVLRRGRDEPETITLVMTPERAKAFAEFLNMVAL